MKMTIKIDVDGVLEDLLIPLIDLYKEAHGIEIPYDSFSRYDFANFKPHVREEFLANLATGDLIDMLEPIEGTYEALSDLNDRYDVFLVTATSVDLFSHKAEWVLKHYPFIMPDRILRVPGRYKSMVNTDFAIDDYHENLKTDIGHRILIDAPFNRNVHDEAFTFHRVKNLTEAVEIIDNIARTEEGLDGRSI